MLLHLRIADVGVRCSNLHNALNSLRNPGAAARGLRRNLHIWMSFSINRNPKVEERIQQARTGFIQRHGSAF